MGYPSHFIRLYGCSMGCAWCDTKYSWKEYEEMSLEDLTTVLKLLKESYTNINNVVITGGEPLEQNIQSLVELCHSFDLDVEVETNGDLSKSATEELPDVDIYIVSPKFLSDKHIEKYTQEVVDKFLEKFVWFKFVCASIDDVNFVSDFCQKRDIPKESVWIMPKGITNEEVTQSSKAIVNSCLSCGYKLSARMHISIWDGKRGV
jgi:organic radical activating enzyme